MKFLKLLLLLTSINLTAQSSRFKDNETLNVWAASGLNMRDKPDAKAAKVATIPYGTKVTVQANIGIKIPFEVEEFKGFIVKGYWLLVKYGNTEGFVFDGFLSRLPAPKSNKREDTALEIYLEKEIGKIGTQYDYQIYDEVKDRYRMANPNEIVEQKEVRGYKQKFKNGITYESYKADSGGKYKITISNSTFFESYILMLVFFNTTNVEYNNLDKREFDKKKQILHLSPTEDGPGCFFDISKIGNSLVIDGYCGC